MNNRTVYSKACGSFTKVSHDITHKNNLNVIEIGLITSLLSNTDDWVVYKETEQHKSGIGRKAFDKAWRGLSQKGFITTQQLKENGRICYLYTISAVPKPSDIVISIQAAEKCVQKTIDTGEASNKELIKKEIINEERNNKEKNNGNSIKNVNSIHEMNESKIPMEIDITSIKLHTNMGREEKIEIIDNVFNVEKRFNELDSSIDFDCKIETLLSIYDDMACVLSPMKRKKEVFTEYHYYRKLKKERFGLRQIFYQLVESAQFVYSDIDSAGKILI